jgi:hypothetical protein
MKKLFLLSFLCVLFTTSFSQINGNYEILTKISITKNANAIIEDEGGERLPYWPFGYKEIKIVTNHRGNISIQCIGQGFMWCFGHFRGMMPIRGIATEILETNCNSLIEESNERALAGESKGSLSKKISIEGSTSYYVFKINWDYHPENPLNGEAEIIVYKVDNFGL